MTRRRLPRLTKRAWRDLGLITLAMFLLNELLAYISYRGDGRWTGPGDVTTTWCAACPQPLDMLGEMTEIFLTYSLLALVLGTITGLLLRRFR